MSLFKKNGGIMNIIRCDEPSYLIWKWRPEGAMPGESNRENSIRWGSSLRVKDGEVAVFVYKQKDGQNQDYIEGPFDEILSTKNLPVLASIMGLAYNGDSPFQAEVYFINLAKIIQTKFGVPFFDVYDSRFPDFGVPLAVRGTITFKITDYKEFIKLHRLIDFNLADFEEQIRSVVNRYIKSVVTNIPLSSNIPLVQIETKTAEINELVENDIKERLNKDFGVDVSGIDISTIEIDKTSEGYTQLMSVTKDIAKATTEAEAAAKIKDIADKQKIDVENYQETLRIQREEGQYAQHKQTQSANMEVFQIEKQAEVGVAGAEALGHMGENGAGSVDIGSGGTGFNPAAMMAGMAIGGTVGQNIAGTMNNILNNNVTSITPPPIPTNKFFVAIDGKQEGPYDKNTLLSMANSSKISKDTLVWKDGMDDWQKIDSIEELKDIFPNIPPIPNDK